MADQDTIEVGAPLGPLFSVPPDIEALRDMADDAGSEIVHITLDEYVPGLPSTIPAFLNRKDGRVDGVHEQFEKYRVHPRRRIGTANVTALESLIELANRHKTESSVLFANKDWRQPSLTAVIDYHNLNSDGPANWLNHRIHYAFPLSEEWKAWMAVDGQPMNQQDFAEWIEIHIPEISAPGSDEVEDFKEMFGLKVAYPNEMLVLSRGLSIHVESRVKNNVVLQTGEGEITWDEEHTDGAGNKISVPGLFVLSIKPFDMGETCRIPVRLRYRARAGTVQWTFKLWRPEDYITQEVLRDVERAASATELPHYFGTPEK